ncbi:class I SAM-dependent methyltransferase [Paenibacillus sp. BC26]|uniref:class I SAM-dependent methyltransferase n=1 Tax=Paenibacillus sp. BC26 TaxID=1881032 RepID=UPI0008EEDA99|nr:class I SAM-dependent methyltransferase [Paenibacillus sp. BC26]SFS76189.1 Methyltransferase domain-containing protein [Paenibacillus sp. BC26]
MQEKQSKVNRLAWNTKAYDAWMNHFGTPIEQAEKLKRDPKYPLRRWLKYMGELKGLRIINLLGSTGSKAIPLAILGAEVTIVDISEENKRYAQDVARAAGVKVNYINSDVLNISNEEELRNFDIVLMEFGILHYFSDLNQIFSVVARMLKPNGRFILTDFHPFAHKLLNDDGNGIVLKDNGDYFDTELREDDIAYTSFVPENERSSLHKVLLRKWTLGEILSAIANQGLYIRILEEEPNHLYKKFPAFYTVVADKITASSPIIPLSIQ